MAEIGHDAEPLGTVSIIFLDRASREKTLAPTDAFVREKTGCISPMAIRQIYRYTDIQHSLTSGTIVIRLGPVLDFLL